MMAQSTDQKEPTKGKTPEKRVIDDDELDNVLDAALADFGPAVAAPETPKKAEPADPTLDGELQRQLEKGMGELLSQMGDGKDSHELLELMKEMSSAMDKTQPSSNPQTAKPFHERVAEQMQRLGDTSAQLAAEPADVALDPMADMMRQIEGLLDSPDFDGMLDNVMESLMTRAVLHEPLRELHDAYGPWLAEHGGALSDAERTKFVGQQKCLVGILAIYDAVPDGAESTDEQNRAVVELLDDMQRLGHPPAEILKRFAPDVEFGPDGEPVAPAGKPNLAAMLAGGAGGQGGAAGDCSVM